MLHHSQSPRFILKVLPPKCEYFKVSGYQVLDKWLKDRKKAKRTLSFDDVLHYQKVVDALKETMQLMVEIDQLIN
ncbi:type ISP restriction/modification enzyme [Leptolyngbyaceae cyanobacterium UHCC 1019]